MNKFDFKIERQDRMLAYISGLDELGGSCDAVGVDKAFIDGALHSTVVKMLEETISHAVIYLKSCGYDKIDFSEPERPMFESFRNALQILIELRENIKPYSGWTFVKK